MDFEEEINEDEEAKEEKPESTENEIEN